MADHERAPRQMNTPETRTPGSGRGGGAPGGGTAFGNSDRLEEIGALPTGVDDSTLLMDERPGGDGAQRGAQTRSVPGLIGEHLARVGDLQAALRHGYDAIDGIRTMGGEPGRPRPSMVVAARNLTSALDNGAQAINEFRSWLGRAQSANLEAAHGALERVTQVLDAFDTLSGITDQRTLDAFLADRSPENAQAWATHVTGIFTSASRIIPDDIPGLPMLVPRMLKGLLAAPATYVDAFLSVLDAYTARVDAATGGPPTAGGSLREGDTLIWAGPLSRWFGMAPQGLQDLMRAHQREDGIDLQTAPASVSIPHLMNLVRSSDASRSEQQQWIAFLHARM